MDDFSRRPWGMWVKLDEGDGFWVKKIIVNPNKKLSLQYHKNRSESWTIIKGCGIIQLGDENIPVGMGDSIEIPVTQKHRVTNTNSFFDLIFIEVAIGEPDEDDIIRIEDDYGRT